MIALNSLMQTVKSVQTLNFFKLITHSQYLNERGNQKKKSETGLVLTAGTDMKGGGAQVDIHN